MVLRMKHGPMSSFLVLASTLLFIGAASGQSRTAAPFDEKADAKAELQKALKHAKKDNRRVLINWGGDTNVWSVLLAKTLSTDAALRRKLLYEYDVVHIAVSKNADLVKQFQVPIAKRSAHLTVLDEHGKVLANQTGEPYQAKSEAGENEIDAKNLLKFLTSTRPSRSSHPRFCKTAWSKR